MLKVPSPRASGRRISHAGGRARRQGGVHNILLMNLSRQAVIPGELLYEFNIAWGAIMLSAIRRPHLGRIF